MFIEGLLLVSFCHGIVCLLPKVVGVPDIPEHLRKKLEQVDKDIWRSKKYGGQKNFGKVQGQTELWRRMLGSPTFSRSSPRRSYVEE
jgi:hypothetical protein